MSEAPLEDGGSGLAPVGEGWFVVNVQDAEWWVTDDFGSGCEFENEKSRFGQLGFNVAVLEPGKPNCLYHRESGQEAFLVVAGECTLLVDGEERPLRKWDFFHCPPGTDHVFVGSGEEPCVVVMVGVRREDEEIVYPVSELAARHGASVEEETPSPEQAYAPYARPTRGRPEYWDRLPWA